MMAKTARLKLVFSAVGVLAAVLVASPRSAEAGVEEFTGVCDVVLEVTRDDPSVSFETAFPGSCVTSAGFGTITIEEGQAGPIGLVPGFTCAGGLGSGSAAITIDAASDSFSHPDVGIALARAGEAVWFQIAMSSGGTTIEGPGALVESGTAVSKCLQGETQTTWAGQISFHTHEVSAKISGWEGHCGMQLDATRTGDSVSFGTAAPQSCLITSGLQGTVSMSGSAGPSGSLPGFTCAGGAGTGTVDITLTTQVQSVTATDVEVTVVNTGGVVVLELSDLEGPDRLLGLARLVQTNTVVGSCIRGEDDMLWGGHLAFSTSHVDF